MVFRGTRRSVEKFGRNRRSDLADARLHSQCKRLMHSSFQLLLGLRLPSLLPGRVTSSSAVNEGILSNQLTLARYWDLGALFRAVEDEGLCD
jgi:hypothetical protein